MACPDRPDYRPDPAAMAAYDVREPALFLVRPDDYLGCVTSDPADITAYRARIGC